MTLAASAFDIEVEDYEKYGIGKYATYASSEQANDSSSRSLNEVPRLRGQEAAVLVSQSGRYPRTFNREIGELMSQVCESWTVNDVQLGNLVHFNRVSSAISMRIHCDFHTLDLAEFKHAIDAIITTKSLWQEALSWEVVESEESGLAYTDESANYPPRRRRFLDLTVRVVPGAKRKRRIYTDEDHQVWRS